MRSRLTLEKHFPGWFVVTGVCFAGFFVYFILFCTSVLGLGSLLSNGFVFSEGSDKWGLSRGSCPAVPVQNKKFIRNGANLLNDYSRFLNTSLACTFQLPPFSHQTARFVSLLLSTWIKVAPDNHNIPCRLPCLDLYQTISSTDFLIQSCSNSLDTYTRQPDSVPDYNTNGFCARS